VQAARRPTGITIISVLSFAAGAIYLLQGLRSLGFVVFGPAGALSNASIIGWLSLLTAAFWIGLGFGFWTLRVWAWFVGLFVVAASLVEAFIGNMSGWEFGDMFGAMIVPLIILFYLSTDDVKRSFDGLVN
jgi:hypothetical protein